MQRRLACLTMQNAKGREWPATRPMTAASLLVSNHGHLLPARLPGSTRAPPLWHIQCGAFSASSVVHSGRHPLNVSNGAWAAGLADPSE